MSTPSTTNRNTPPLVGAHMSVAGGAWKAFERARRVGANCLQVFVKSNVQWRIPSVSDEAVARFVRARAESGIDAVVAHSSYLVNVATSDRTIWRRSVADLEEELALAGRYGMPWLVFHPGNHMGTGVDRAVKSVAEAIRRTLDTNRGNAGLAIETTAGAGTAVGSRLEEIGEIIDRAGAGPRVGVCVDTAHIFAAGYDITSEEGYAAFKRRLRRLGLLGRVKAIHVNDSKGALGSHLDRHEHIGRGRIGRNAFRRIMRDRDFARVPKILETPKGMCGARDCDAVNIALLRRLATTRQSVGGTPL